MTWFAEIEWAEHGPNDYVKNRPLEGRSVVIIGGGPSLTKERMEILRTCERAIIVNNAYQVWPRPAVLVALDRRWWGDFGHGANVRAAGHLPITAMRKGCSAPVNFRVYTYLKETDAFYSPLRHILIGRNSGHAAAHLAVHLGAQRIYFAGFDMGFTQGRSHWHAGHVIPASENNYERRFRPKFEKLCKWGYRQGLIMAAITPTYASVPTVPFDTAIEDLHA